VTTRTFEEIAQDLSAPVWHLLRCGNTLGVAQLLTASGQEAGVALFAERDGAVERDGDTKE
jgi:hypothetical protein